MMDPWTLGPVIAAPACAWAASEYQETPRHRAARPFDWEQHETKHFGRVQLRSSQQHGVVGRCFEVAFSLLAGQVDLPGQHGWLL